MLEFNENVLDQLISARHLSVKPSAFSEMIDKLIWLIDCNHINLGLVLEGWLTSADDKFKVEVALGVKEFFPIKGEDDNRLVLSKIQQIWPDLANQCETMLIEYLKHND